MFVLRSHIQWRKLRVAGMLGAFILAGLTHQAGGQTRTISKEEQDAITVVNSWNAAWATKDPEKLGAYMAENCEFRADPRETELKKGRAQFVTDIKRIVELGITIQVVDTVAYGGEAGTAVLQKRIDTITINGQKKRDSPGGVFPREGWQNSGVARYAAGDLRSASRRSWTPGQCRTAGESAQSVRFSIFCVGGYRLGFVSSHRGPFCGRL